MDRLYWVQIEDSNLTEAPITHQNRQIGKNQIIKKIMVHS